MARNVHGDAGVKRGSQSRLAVVARKGGSQLWLAVVARRIIDGGSQW